MVGRGSPSSLPKLYDVWPIVISTDTIQHSSILLIDLFKALAMSWHRLGAVWSMVHGKVPVLSATRSYVQRSSSCMSRRGEPVPLSLSFSRLTL